MDEILSVKPFDGGGSFYSDVPSRSGRSLALNFTSGAARRSVFFQEPCWIPVLAHLASLPLWFATASPIDKTMRASANHDMGTELYQTFVKAGLPEPAMRMELPVGKEPYLAQWYYDTLCSVRPQMEQLHLPIESLGSLGTLVHRLQAEVAKSKTVACWFASVGAWCRKP